MIYAIANQKGGVGKTTTAAAMLAGLTKRGRYVLGIDLDQQGNLSYTVRAKSNGQTILGVLLGEITAADARQETPDGVFIPYARGLNAAEKLFTETGREYHLREALEPIRWQYDDIVIDTPPALGVLTMNALCAADAVIVPARADIYSLQAIMETAKAVQTVRTYCRGCDALFIDGILLTQHNARATISKEAEQYIKEQADRLGTRVYAARIREGVAVRESAAVRSSIFDYAPKSGAAADYNAFLDELTKGAATP